MAAEFHIQPMSEVVRDDAPAPACSALLVVTCDDATLAAIRQNIADGKSTTVTATQMRALGLDALAEALATQAGGS